MKRWKTKLSAILVIQLLAAASLWALEHHRQSSRQQSVLLAQVDPAQVRTLEISSGDDSVKIVKEGDGWLLPDYHNLPAHQGNVSSLLEDLKELKSLEVVSRSENGHERFQVTEEEPQAELKLLAGDGQELCRLLVGKNRSFGKAYLRKPGESDVHVATWNVMGSRSKAEYWLDRSLLATKNVKSLEFPEFKMTKVEGKWESGGEKLSLSAAKHLASQIENFAVSKAVELEVPETSFKVVAVDTGDNRTTYSIFEHDEKQYVKTDGYDIAFQVYGNAAQQLRDASLDRLKPEEDEKKGGDDQSAAP